MLVTNKGTLGKNTTHTVVLPFYVYAAVSFLAATILLFIYSSAFTQHYFHPKTLAITHTMALGWGTMIILGASHQLVPVLIEGRLFSIALAHVSFVLAASGIPLLVFAFFQFNMGWPAQWGGLLINAAILAYVINLALSIAKSKKENIHAVFVFTAALWLLITTLVGLLLVYNFSYSFLANDSLHYLSLHAHMGIVGWFLVLIIGVASRLIPLFLVSKYDNPRLLWLIYGLINCGLTGFVFIFLFFRVISFYLLPLSAIALALILFGYYCYRCYKHRLRRQVDEQVKISMLSVSMMALPVIFLLIMIIFLLVSAVNTRLVLLYGVSIFFGWITAIILGMTFKTLPFIVWNKLYHLRAGIEKTPSPKDLFSNKLFTAMGVGYLSGLLLFITGIYLSNIFLLKFATAFLLLAAVLYNWNTGKILLHKPGTP
jgi:hypothetical protein